MVSIKVQLTAKHNEFIGKLFINGFDATKAYSELYPNNKTPEYSGCRLLHSVKIKAEIERRQGDLAVKVDELGLHSKEISINNLNRAYDIALKQANPAGMVAAEREKNAISNLHSSTLHTDIVEQHTVDKAKSICAKRLAEQIVLNSNKRKLIESKEIENEV